MLGSPNTSGNTAVLLQQYLKGIKDNHSDTEIRNVFFKNWVLRDAKVVMPVRLVK